MSYYFLYFVTFSINTICFCTGTAYSWTSPLIPKFQSNDTSINPLERPLNLMESGLLVSLINLGLLIGPFLSGLIVNKLGKKKTILVCGIPLFVAHLMCTFATTLEEFIVARLLMGLNSGAVWTVIPGYLSEISEPKNRGLLNCLMVLNSCFGILFSYLVGPFVSVKLFSIINLIPIAMHLILVHFFVPESPYDLLMKENLISAEKSLIKLKGTNEVNKDIIEIQCILKENSKKLTISSSFKDIFRNSGSLNALFICGTIMVFNSLSGAAIVAGYAESIFNMVSNSIPSSKIAILVGATSVFGTFLNCLLIDRLGRKPLMLISCIVAGISHGSLAIFFYLQNTDVNLDTITWLPICNVIMFMWAFYLGLASLPYVILGELFPPQIKAIASSICTTINYTLMFIITLLYAYMINGIGTGNTFLIFAFTLLSCIGFCIWKLPETKGKTFQEIYKLLN